MATIAVFYPTHAGVALLLLAYLAWVTFAAAHNCASILRQRARGKRAVDQKWALVSANACSCRYSRRLMKTAGINVMFGRMQRQSSLLRWPTNRCWLCNAKVYRFSRTGRTQPPGQAFSQDPILSPPPGHFPDEPDQGVDYRRGAKLVFCFPYVSHRHRPGSKLPTAIR